MTSDVADCRLAGRRWRMIYATTPSGKTLFQCGCCGNVLPTPSKDCRTIGDPNEEWACSAWPNQKEEMERRRYLAEGGDPD